MIAVTPVQSTQTPCVVKWVGRRGLTVKIVTYCGAVADAAQGVFQVPDGTFVCEKCRAALNGSR